MKKNNEIRIRVSEEEKKKIKEKAETLGLSVAGFIRFISLKSTITPTNED